VNVLLQRPARNRLLHTQSSIFLSRADQCLPNVVAVAVVAVAGAKALPTTTTAKASRRRRRAVVVAGAAVVASTGHQPSAWWMKTANFVSGLHHSVCFAGFSSSLILFVPFCAVEEEEDEPKVRAQDPRQLQLQQQIEAAMSKVPAVSTVSTVSAADSKDSKSKPQVSGAASPKAAEGEMKRGMVSGERFQRTVLPDIGTFSLPALFRFAFAFAFLIVSFHLCLVRSCD
jgi:hypothetical protein